MKNFDLKKLWPHAAAILFFALITLAYFSPLLEGKKISQSDVMIFKGMSKEITDFRKEKGQEPLWTNSMFGGMPAYQISVTYPSNLLPVFRNVLTLGIPFPASIIFLCLIGFYLLLIIFKVDPLLAAAGAVAFAFSSYFFGCIEAGHNTKGLAIAFMAPVIAGVILTYRGRVYLGASLTALCLSFEILSNHLQITYYLLIILVVLAIAEFYKALKNKQIPDFVKRSVFLGIAAMLAIGPNITNLLATAEYGKYTIRGQSELTEDQANKTGGLDRDYATQWSYGVGESFTLMIPNFKGGGSGAINTNKDNKSALNKVDPQFREYVGNVDQYWGDQPFTSGPVYVSAIICFLFILGLFLLEGPLKWWLFTVTVLSIMLSWGKNFMPLTDFFLDYIPGYNKFRAVSMTLVIAELAMPLLAILAVKKVIDTPGILKTKRKQFLIALGLTAGLCLLFYTMPGLFLDFFKTGEYDQITGQLKKSQLPDDQVAIFMNGVEEARKSIFDSDVLRSFFLIVLSAVLLFLYSIQKISKPILYSVLGLLLLGDMWMVDKRYLNKDNFVSKSRMETPYEASQADNFILQDKDPGFRVLNLTVSPFNDASTSYFHKSIGGYHGAKLKRYQELIDHQLQKNIESSIAALKAKSGDSINMILPGLNGVNMLNTRYIIYNPDAPPLKNPYASGAAWFVKKYALVDNSDQEINALDKLKIKEEAVVDKRYSEELSGFTPTFDSASSIKLVSYEPNHLVYESAAKGEQFAVFSEIFYDKGWNVYVDGAQKNYVRADYLLRGMRVPAGTHKIEFKFEPEVYARGEKIALVSSILLLLGLVVGVYMDMKSKKSDEVGFTV
jgi:hypothetical protein